MPKFALILPAAGRSTRFGGATSKLLEPLAGLPVLSHSLSAFLQRDDVALVVLAMAPGASVEELPSAVRAMLDDPRVTICAGGASRAESVRNAARCVPAQVEWVAVHDAARPLVSQALIDRTLVAAVAHGAALPALAVTSTVKRAAAPLPARVELTVPRAALWAVQTPQVMRRESLLAAIDTSPIPLADVTDDAQLLELAGHDVWLVPGEEQNLKITTPLDLKVAELLLRERGQIGKRPPATLPQRD